MGQQPEVDITDLQRRNDQLARSNTALTAALERATTALEKAKSQLNASNDAPRTLATMVRVVTNVSDRFGVQHATAQVMVGQRAMVVPVSASMQASRLQPGATVALDESMVVVDQYATSATGLVRSVSEVLPDGRLLVSDTSGATNVVQPSHQLRSCHVEPSDRVSVDPSFRFALELLPAPDTRELILEQVPNVSFADIGGQKRAIERIQDAIELPYLHRDLYERFHLSAPKGVLLYGHPGNGKTMIAKAVAHSLSQGASGGVFLSVKGPELLNKYVGESERCIRLIFSRARERAQDGTPVVVFIDEMDSLLRTRGSGVSSDMETTIVPQFLAELDGIESLNNVLVIGASNRIDMIDPAVLRPGRLDVKIYIDRPDEAAAAEIMAHYITDALPLEGDAQTMAQAAVRDMYARVTDRQLALVCDERGDWSPLYLADLMSGAMIKNIADVAKTYAVKASLTHGDVVRLTGRMLGEAVEQQFLETREALGDVNPEQWSKVNGIDSGAITRIRATRDDR